MPVPKSGGQDYSVFIREGARLQGVIRREECHEIQHEDKADGTFHEQKGKVKEVAGKLSDNPTLEAEGTGEKIAGKIQQKIGQVKKVFGK